MMAEKYAVRNLRLCTKDCLCLYVCPTGATDTEDSVIDVNKCIGCGICTTKCEFDAIRLSRDLPECSTMVRTEDKFKAILPYIEQLDLVLVMTVEPGFGGQAFMPEQLDTIREVRQIINRYNPACELEVDGGIAPKTAPLVIEAGANVLVAGSAVYGAEDIPAAIRALRG